MCMSSGKVNKCALPIPLTDTSVGRMKEQPNRDMSRRVIGGEGGMTLRHTG